FLRQPVRLGYERGPDAAAADAAGAEIPIRCQARGEAGGGAMSGVDSSGREAVVRVFRGDASGGTEVEYRVPIEPGMVVLDAIHWIQAHRAPDLAVRWNCKAAKCGSCSAEVNGKPSLMCKTRMDHFAEGEAVSVRPMKTFPLIRDLVTDVSWN